MGALLANQARSTLAADALNTDTTITVQTGDASKFPSPSDGDWFPLVLTRPDTSFEIVRCTARSGAVLTVARGQEGTLALPFATGDAAHLAVTAAVMAEKLSSATIVGASAKTAPADADLFPLMDSAASFAPKKLTWANLKARIWAAFGALIAGGTAKSEPTDADNLALSDSAAANASKRVTLLSIRTWLETYFATPSDLAELGEATDTALDGKLSASSNLSDVGNAVTARSNLKIWTGTLAQYEAISSKDADTIYFAT